MTDQALLPSDLPLERLVLGQALVGRHWSALAAAGVEATDFFRVVHQQVWEAAGAVAQRGDPVDVVAVWLELRDRDWLEEIGQPYFNALTSDVLRVNEATLHTLVRRLRDLALSRHAILAVRHLEGDLRDHPTETSEVIGDAVPALAAVGDHARFGSADTLMAEGQLAALTEECHRDLTRRLLLGIPTFDNLTGGVHPGEVIGLMARPGVGKTLLLGHITRYLAEGTLGTVFVSLEMPLAQIVERLARGLYELDRRRLMQAVRDASLARARYLEAFASLAINARAGLSVSQIEARVRRVQAAELMRTGVSVVIVDHLGLVGGDRTLSTYDRVSLHARELKELAKRLNVLVILAIQVSREAGGVDGARELTLGSARDSGVVEEAVDYLVGMRRLDRAMSLTPADRERYRDVLFLTVLKNRHGVLGHEFALRMDPASLLLLEDTTTDAPAEDAASRAAAGWRR